jgi:hypothetical protein
MNYTATEKSLRRHAWGRFVFSAVLLAAILGGRDVRAAQANAAGSITVTSRGHAQVSIVVGAHPSEAYQYAAAELARYLRLLSGAEISVVTDGEIASRAAQEAVIVVGGPEVSNTAREAAAALRANLRDLKPEGFLIRTGRLRNRAVVLVAGNDGISTMYAVYELVERLGVTFRLTGDIIPKPKDDLSIPPLDVRMEPAMARRGFLVPDAGYENITMFSYDDYSKLIDQMAKMKCNYMQFWWFAYEPWLKYGYKGETMWMGDVSSKESGYLTWAHGGFGSRTTDDVSIGKELFKGRRIAPPEMQNVESSDEAFKVAEDLLHRIIRHANERGIKVWLAIELDALPPNLARHCERVGSLPFFVLSGTFVHPLDEVNREIQTNRLKALFDTYPEAEGYFLNVGEMYPELNNEKYRAFFEQKRPEFFDLRQARFPWVIDIPQDSNLVVDSNAGYFDLFQYLLKQRDHIAPKAKIGLMGVGRGYALPLFNRLLPKDVVFTDMESSGVWTPAGLPMQIFGGMGERERTIEPRVDDDFEMMGMQFSVKQYSVNDKIFTDGLKYGLTGFAGQIDRVRGTETNSSYLTQAAWSPQLGPEEFYKGYSSRIFGAKAAPAMYRAYMALEDNQEYVGYNSNWYLYTMMNCCSSLPEVHMGHRLFEQPNMFDGPTTSDWKGFVTQLPDTIVRFEGSIGYLNKALDAMRQALPDVAPQGDYELRYMINRTQSYRDYIASLVTMRKAFLQFDKAFQDRPKLSHEQFVAELTKALDEFSEANRQVQAATREYTEFMDSPSDLGVLYHLNARAVLGFDLIRQTMQNILNFHTGKPYLQHVQWERLFSPDLHAS